MSQFNRVVEVEIIDQYGGKAVVIRDLAIKFSVDKTSLSTKDSCSIEIYNLSEDTRNSIDKTGSTVILKAGYKDDGLNVIFTGDVSSFEQSYVAPNWITKINAKDGKISLDKTKISIVFSEYTKITKMISDIVAKAGWTKNNDIMKLKNVEDFELSGGYMGNDLVKPVLDFLCGMIKVQWSIQDNAITFSTLDGVSSETVTVVSADTGMIGIPQKEEKPVDTVSKKTKNSKTANNAPGYRVKSLIKHTLRPGSKVHLISDKLKLNGEFKVGEVHHSGSTHDSTWETTFKALLPQDTRPVGDVKK